MSSSRTINSAYLDRAIINRAEILNLKDNNLSVNTQKNDELLFLVSMVIKHPSKIIII